MKKELWPFFIVCLFSIFGMFFASQLVSKHKPEKAEQSTETIESERSKDFSVIKVVNIIDTVLAVDAFGNKLKLNEWYVQSNVTRVVFPINTKSTNYTNLDWLMSNGKKELARVNITNGQTVGTYVDAEILLLGEKILVLNDLEQHQVVWVK